MNETRRHHTCPLQAHSDPWKAGCNLLTVWGACFVDRDGIFRRTPENVAGDGWKVSVWLSLRLSPGPNPGAHRSLEAPSRFGALRLAVSCGLDCSLFRGAWPWGRRARCLLHGCPPVPSVSGGCQRVRGASSGPPSSAVSSASRPPAPRPWLRPDFLLVLRGPSKRGLRARSWAVTESVQEPCGDA